MRWWENVLSKLTYYKEIKWLHEQNSSLGRYYAYANLLAYLVVGFTLNITRLTIPEIKAPSNLLWGMSVLSLFLFPIFCVGILQESLIGRMYKRSGEGFMHRFMKPVYINEHYPLGIRENALLLAHEHSLGIESTGEKAEACDRIARIVDFSIDFSGKALFFRALAFSFLAASFGLLCQSLSTHIIKDQLEHSQLFDYKMGAGALLGFVSTAISFSFDAPNKAKISEAAQATSLRPVASCRPTFV